MTKDKAIKKLDALKKHGVTLLDACIVAKEEMWESVSEALDMAIEALSEPSRQVQRWIPCSERLPETGKEVLVCYDFKGCRSVLIGALYGDGKFHGYDDEYLTPEGRKYRKATAWAPLPEPYKEEGDE